MRTRATRSFLMGVAAVVVLFALGACAEDECSSKGASGPYCLGSVRVTCLTRSIDLHDCADEGLGCVDTAEGAVCASPDPACTTDSYCKGDTLVYCAPEVPGHRRGERPCAPYPCVHVEGGEPAVCVEPETQCFKRPDGQYCWQHSDEAFECLKGGKVRSNKQCPRCYVDEAGKAASWETSAPCL